MKNVSIQTQKGHQPINQNVTDHKDHNTYKKRSPFIYTKYITQIIAILFILRLFKLTYRIVQVINRKYVGKIICKRYAYIACTVNYYVLSIVASLQGRAKQALKNSLKPTKDSYNAFPRITANIDQLQSILCNFRMDLYV